jgi:hypothetical protein
VDWVVAQLELLSGVPQGKREIVSTLLLRMPGNVDRGRQLSHLEMSTTIKRDDGNASRVGSYRKRMGVRRVTFVPDSLLPAKEIQSILLFYSPPIFSPSIKGAFGFLL